MYMCVHIIHRVQPIEMMFHLVVHGSLLAVSCHSGIARHILDWATRCDGDKLLRRAINWCCPHDNARTFILVACSKTSHGLRNGLLLSARSFIEELFQSRSFVCSYMSTIHSQIFVYFRYSFLQFTDGDVTVLTYKVFVCRAPHLFVVVMVAKLDLRPTSLEYLFLVGSCRLHMFQTALLRALLRLSFAPGVLLRNQIKIYRLSTWRVLLSSLGGCESIWVHHGLYRLWIFILWNQFLRAGWPRLRVDCPDSTFHNFFCRVNYSGPIS